MPGEIDFEDALPIELTDDPEVPQPAFFVGPIYTGNGGHEARSQLESALSGIPKQVGDEVALPAGETAAAADD